MNHKHHVRREPVIGKRAAFDVQLRTHAVDTDKAAIAFRTNPDGCCLHAGLAVDVHHAALTDRQRIWDVAGRGIIVIGTNLDLGLVTQHVDHAAIGHERIAFALTRDANLKTRT